jgi:hypothetical protein
LIASSISARGARATPATVFFEETKPLLDGEFTELVGDAAAQYHLENSVTEVIPIRAIYWARIDRVYFGTRVSDTSKIGFDDEF